MSVHYMPVEVRVTEGETITGRLGEEVTVDASNDRVMIQIIEGPYEAGAHLTFEAARQLHAALGRQIAEGEALSHA